MDKQNVVCIYNRILFILKRKEILQYATAWMNIEDIMCNEISQSQKDKPYDCISLYEVLRVVEIIKWNGGARD